MRGGFKSKEEDVDPLVNRMQGWIAVGLVDEDAIKEWPQKLPDIQSKFVAIYNFKGHIHAAFTNKNKLQLPSLMTQLDQLKQTWKLLKSTMLEDDHQIKDLEGQIAALEERITLLTNEPNYLSIPNEKDRI